MADAGVPKTNDAPKMPEYYPKSIDAPKMSKTYADDDSGSESSEEEGAYIVEAIVSKRTLKRRGRTGARATAVGTAVKPAGPRIFYLVKWKGYTADENRSDLLDDK